MIKKMKKRDYPWVNRLFRRNTQRPASTGRIPDLRAVILSDLHFSDNRNAIASILPLVSTEDELMETITRQVIHEKPDVFIMTGDNTSNGRDSEVQTLLPYLQRIKDAGIPVICIPGNHDFARMDKETWKQYYYPLCTITDRDTDTLSYSAVIHGVKFLAMDDCSYSHGDHGEFPVSTMRWLRKELLSTPVSMPVVFLSHYSVLTGRNTREDIRYRIQNPRLYNLLKNAHVKLCFSGHQHNRKILKDREMYEIISGTPLAYPHTLGILKITGTHVSCRTELIDFDQYGPEHYAAKVRKLNHAHDLSMTKILRGIVSRLYTQEDEIREITALFLRILTAAQGGTLYEQLKDIQANPYYDKMFTAMASTNYGPWLDTLFKTTIHSSCTLDFTLDEQPSQRRVRM